MQLGKMVKHYIIFVIMLFSFTACDFLIGPMMDGAGTSPDKIEGLALWLRADKGAYRNATDDCAPPLEPAQNGANVTCWVDQSTNKLSFQLIKGSFSPLVQNYSGMNDQKVVFFPSASNSFFQAAINPMNSLSVFTVSKLGGLFPDQTIIEFNDGSVNTFGHRTNSNSDFEFYNDFGVEYSSSTFQAGTKASLLSSTYGSNFEINNYYNGKKIESAAGLGSVSVLNQLLVGSDLSTKKLNNGYIGEIILYNRVLSENERQDVESYLGKKYGIEPAE